MPFDWDIPMLQANIGEGLLAYRTGRNIIMSKTLVTRNIVKVVCTHAGVRTERRLRPDPI